MAEKANTQKDLDQAVIDLGVKLCEDYGQGRVINDAQGKLLDAIIKLYNVTKVREPPSEKVNTGKSK